MLLLHPFPGLRPSWLQLDMQGEWVWSLIFSALFHSEEGQVKILDVKCIIDASDGDRVLLLHPFPGLRHSWLQLDMCYFFCLGHTMEWEGERGLC